MRTLLGALTALMLLATPVVAGDYLKAVAALAAGNYQEAFRFITPFAEQGEAWAEAILGTMYANGEGVPQNDVKAVYWFRKAAEQGDAGAQFNLAYMYANGEGVPQNDVKAVYWNRKAAEQGDAGAQANLGGMYYNGDGVLEDYVQAYAWTSIAASRGDKLAKRNKGIMKKKMTREQIAKGQELSSELWEKYVVPFQKN